MIIGGGSNILFTKNYEGVVLKNNLKGIDVIREDTDYIWVRAGGGELWHTLVMFCVERNYGGIENLSLIPGSVGAAPLQNIGAYGVELVHTFYELEAMDLSTGGFRIFDKSACGFGYRDSVFKNVLRGKYFITSVTLQLRKQPVFHVEYGAIRQTLEAMHINTYSVKAISDAVIAIRRSKLPDPEDIGNAGSFFKNPEIDTTFYTSLKQKFPQMPGYAVNENKTKVPAGWLIEQCGWKGKRVGDAGVHKDQALVIVNYGKATGDEIYALAMEVKITVKDKFGIDINPEVNIV